MTRQEVMPFVGKYVEISWPAEDQGFVLICQGILALHKVFDEVCIGYGDRVDPPLDSFEAGSVAIHRLKYLEERPLPRGFSACWGRYNMLTGVNRPFDKSYWLFEPIQELSQPTQSMWNTVCPICGAVAYNSGFSFECSSSGCSFGKR